MKSTVRRKKTRGRQLIVDGSHALAGGAVGRDGASAAVAASGGAVGRDGTTAAAAASGGVFGAAGAATDGGDPGTVAGDSGTVAGVVSIGTASTGGDAAEAPTGAVCDGGGGDGTSAGTVAGAAAGAAVTGDGTATGPVNKTVSNCSICCRLRRAESAGRDGTVV